MEFEKIVTDAIEYSRDTFLGHWTRWLIFVLLGLPFSLIRFVVDPAKIVDKTTIHWELIPWGSIAVLVLAGIITSFFVAGYTVRIYRGTKPAPDFTGWVSLFIDGIKLDIVIIVWFLPGLVLGLAALALLVGGLFMPGVFPPLNNPALILALGLALIVALVLFIIAALYVTIGAIRFTRAGSMIEGWRFSAVSGIIRRIGWANYFIALVLLGVVSVLFSLAVSVPAIIPYVGWIVPVALAPFLTVFSARYFALVYEAGEAPPPVSPAA
ncbi:MAG TPA: DUF4013 domain-containing protein [Methanomicrobiales archaeon]|nr:DUF4013 domain-containing protein [Methanomicrobiales archaeon]